MEEKNHVPCTGPDCPLCKTIDEVEKEMDKVVVIGTESSTRKALKAASILGAMESILPGSLDSALAGVSKKFKPASKLFGPPKLSGKRLERMKKQCQSRQVGENQNENTPSV